MNSVKATRNVVIWYDVGIGCIDKSILSEDVKVHWYKQF